MPVSRILSQDSVTLSLDLSSDLSSMNHSKFQSADSLWNSSWSSTKWHIPKRKSISSAKFVPNNSVRKLICNHTWRTICRKSHLACNALIVAYGKINNEIENSNVKWVLNDVTFIGTRTSKRYVHICSATRMIGSTFVILKIVANNVPHLALYRLTYVTFI